MTGIEFHPGNARVVHHANIRIDRTDATRRLDEADPLPGYDGLMPRSAEYPEGHFLGWTPGQMAPLVPAGAGVDARAGQRSRRAAAHAAKRRGRRGVAGNRVLLHRSRAGAHADHPAARLAGHRHPAGRIALRGSRFLRVARGRRTARRPAPRALPRPRNPRRGAASRRHVAPGDAHQGLGFPLAARLSRRKRRFRCRRARGCRWNTPTTIRRQPRNPELPPARVFWGQRSRDEMGDLWFQLLRQ